MTDPKSMSQPATAQVRGPNRHAVDDVHESAQLNKGMCCEEGQDSEDHTRAHLFVLPVPGAVNAEATILSLVLLMKSGRWRSSALLEGMQQQVHERRPLAIGYGPLRVGRASSLVLASNHNTSHQEVYFSSDGSFLGALFEELNE